MSNSVSNNEVVSFDDEPLILVDDEDREQGFLNKALCHDGEGQLHRAFSLFVFNEQGELLLQQRSKDKRLWPLYWSNTCCSHPRKGETVDVATHRRLQQELGMTSELSYLYKFQYHARYENLGSERELCWVYMGKSSDTVKANDNEVAATRWIRPEALSKEIETHAEQFTPWFKMEWQRISEDFSEQLKKMTVGG